MAVLFFDPWPSNGNRLMRLRLWFILLNWDYENVRWAGYYSKVLTSCSRDKNRPTLR